jgi:NADPH-dependent 7-cyano-7-deazaguanine reductase QueF-like protein
MPGFKGVSGISTGTLTVRERLRKRAVPVLFQGASIWNHKAAWVASNGVVKVAVTRVQV